MNTRRTALLALLALATPHLAIGCSCGDTHLLGADAGPSPDAAGQADARSVTTDADRSDTPASPPSGLSACGALGDGEIAAAAVSADGALYAVADFDTVRLIDATTGQLLRTLGTDTGRSGSASALAFSSDGATLYLGTSDGIRVLSVADGSVLRDIAVARGCCGVSHVALSLAAGRALAYSEGFRVIDLATGAIRELALEGPPADGFDLSPDGTLAAFPSREGVLLVDVATGAPARTLALRGASSVRFSPDGARIAVAIRDVSAPEVEHVVAVARTDGTGAPATRALPVSLSFPVAWSGDGHVHVGLDDGTLLDLSVPEAGGALVPSGPSRRAPIAHPYTLAVSSDGTVFATRAHAAALDADGSLRWMRAGSTGRVPMHELAFDARGDLLADGVLWDVETGLATRVLDPALGRASLDAAGRALAWIDDGFVHVELEGALAARFRATVDDEGAVEAEALAIDDGTVILATPTAVSIVGRDTGLPFSRNPLTVRRSLVLLERSPDGLHVLVGAAEDPPQVISLLGGRDDTPPELARRGVVRGPDAARFLPDGRIASALFPTHALTIHALDGTLTEVPEVPLVRGLALSPRGELIALRLDGISVHDGTTFEELMFLDGEGAAPQLNAVAVSPDGTRIAWTSRDRVEITCIARE